MAQHKKFFKLLFIRDVVYDIRVNPLVSNKCFYLCFTHVCLRMNTIFSNIDHFQIVQLWEIAKVVANK